MEHLVLYVLGAQSVQISFRKTFKIRTAVSPSGSPLLRTRKELKDHCALEPSRRAQMWPGTGQRIAVDVTSQRKGLKVSAKRPTYLSA